ncbi:MAG: MoaD/ThiS family protein [Chloroflexota bacterium]
MSVRVNIAPMMQHLTGGQPMVEVKGDTVGQCLEQLLGRFPGLGDWLLDAGGRLRDSIDVFVNQRSTFPEELARPVSDGDEIHIVALISGG